jgi:diguanylate cyclase (GGDEF)-like protein
MAATLDSEVSPSLLAAASRERLRQSLAQAVKLEATVPLGWGLGAWFAWGYVPLQAIALWLGLFAVALAFILFGLFAARRRVEDFERSYRHYRALIALDGFAWGMLGLTMMGYSLSVDTMLFTLLCGVSAANAAVHVMFIRVLGLQYLAIFIPLAAHTLFNLHDPRIVQLLIGIAIFFVLLLYYMNHLGKAVSNNVLLTLQNEALTGQLKVALSTVEREAATDVLTKIANRRALVGALDKYKLQFEVNRVPFMVLLLDIDHFKQVNDRHGHGVGDEVLQAFCRRVSATVRPSDLFARLGGEEFVIVVPSATMEGARGAAERVRKAVAAKPLLLNPELQVTVSIGIAAYREGMSIDDLLAAADRAVYAAKHNGRNQVCTADAPEVADRAIGSAVQTGGGNVGGVEGQMKGRAAVDQPQGSASVAYLRRAR